MIKLLKYDWKRNANLFLSVGAILIILQVTISVVGNVRDWVESAIFVLTVMLYGFTGMLLMISILKTFDKNIKAYSRRLLPIRPIWSLISPLVLGWISSIVLNVMIIVHFLLYSYMADQGAFNQLTNEIGLILSTATAGNIILAVFNMWWWFTYLYIAIALAITIAATVRNRGGVWLGILSFIVIQSVISWIDSTLFYSNAVAKSGFTITVGPSTIERVTEINDFSWNTFSWGSALLEFIAVAIMIFAIVRLINRKVEI